jgi:crotonobetainyl-CoA:carnitine CoA-transferase CaiB-like acyl-CoA transferase
MTAEKVFAGLKVVEIASVLAGPLVGSFFAELGAKVLKIENKNQGGDITRTWKLPIENSPDSASAYFASANYGKKSLFINLANPEDRAALEIEIGKADILITNLKKSSLLKYKLDHQTLSINHPALIFGWLTGYRSDHTKLAYDIVQQAECGFLSMMGEEGSSRPVRMPVAMIDIIASHQLQEAILVSMIQRAKTGKGSCIEVSLDESGISALANQASNYLNCAYVPGPMGTLHPNIAPYGEIFETGDNVKFVVAVAADHQFKAWMQILKLDDLADEPKFNNNARRVENRKELAGHISLKVRKQSAQVLFKKMNKSGIPFGCIRNLNEVLEDKAYTRMIHTNPDGRKRVSSIAFHLSHLK